MKKAILIISLGTRYTDELEKTITTVKKKISRDFSIDIFIASVIIQEHNTKATDVKTTLQKLYDSGYTDVFCVSTHVIRGSEYKRACDMLNAFTDKMNIRISRPLISTPKDCFEIAGIFLKRLTDRKRLYILVGHGSNDFSNHIYSLLDCSFKNVGMDNMYVGTVKGPLTPEVILHRAGNIKTKDVTLLPLMFVSGAHARHDMGEKWRAELERHGFDVQCDFTGLGEIDEICEMYLSHLRDIMN